MTALILLTVRNVDHPAWSHRFSRAQQLGKERAIRADFIIRNLHHDNPKPNSLEVLLIFEIPVKSYKNFEDLLSECN